MDITRKSTLLLAVLFTVCDSQETTCKKSEGSDITMEQLLLTMQDIQERLGRLENYVKPIIYVNGTTSLAIGKPAFQSSTYVTETGVTIDAIRALPGSNSCSHTQKESNPWWAVDLLQRERVYRVEFSSRGDDASKRLRNVYVGVTNINPAIVPPNLHNFKICTFSQTAFSPAETRVLDCEEDFVEGRFLIVQTAVDDYLELCALKVYGKVRQT